LSIGYPVDVDALARLSFFLLFFLRVVVGKELGMLSPLAALGLLWLTIVSMMLLIQLVACAR